ncbi:MAG: FAD-dependent oxidoreductase [Bacteroidia bacterium]|nr:FAD-dependent oxidoreductase [Bacteroidia bacterium]
MKVAVIGAGPSGLAAANELTSNGVGVDVFENEQTVGGLAKCINLWGEQVEMGPHFLLLHTQNAVKTLLENILGDDVYKYNRLSRIYLNGKYYDYPPKPFNIIKNMGSVKTMAAAGSAMVEMMVPTKNNGTVESYVQSSIGNYLYENFFKGYTEKLWGIPCNSITEEYAKSLIGFDKLSVGSIAKKIFADKNAAHHKQCIYPKEGMGMIWQRLSQKVQQQGGNILLNTSVKGAVMQGKRIAGLVMPDGTERLYDYVFSSVPEAAILRLMPDVPATLVNELKQIKFRRVILVYMQVDPINLITDNTVYIYSTQVKAARITNYNRFKNLEGNHIIMCEYWTSDTENMWTMSDDEMLALALNDVKIFSGAEKLRVKNHHVLHMKNAYPVPDLKLSERKNMLSDFMKTFEGFSAVGRANQKLFNFSMESAMMDGITEARNIMQGTTQS